VSCWILGRGKLNEEQDNDKDDNKISVFLLNKYEKEGGTGQQSSELPFL